MTNKITFHQVVDCLEKNNQSYVTLTLQNKVSLVISERGGRIFGPFLSPEGESIFWLNSAFANPDSFKAFLDSGDWNLGGERIWVAPEVQYLVKDRSDFWGTVGVPEQVDPGNYSLEQTKPGQWKLAQDVSLSAYNLASGQKELHLDKLINQVEDPLRNLSNYQSLLEGVIFAGYEQLVTLSESKSDDIASETWNLIQLNPGGQLLIPATPYLEFSDYYEAIDENYQSLHSNYISLKITGDRRYKVGYKAAHVFGRLAYFNHFGEDQSYLIGRNFFNNPASPYVEEPADWPGRRGHSIHVYNDGGMFGGFGELECNGQTIGGETGRASSVDQFVLWLYVGATDKVKKITSHLLGVEL